MGIAILINPHARHGSKATGARIQELFPSARVAVTSTVDEMKAWVRDDLARQWPDLVLSGGGDGTAVGLLNELRQHGVDVRSFGLLPLGTGNGWARSSGGVGRRAAMRDLRALQGQVAPCRPFPLVETEGRLTPFAGVGWDAEILADYSRMRDETPSLLQDLGGSKLGYFRSIVTKTLPRRLREGRANVRIVNLGPPAFTVDAKGALVPLAGAGAGATLYEGPFSICGASTTEELGFGFRGFAFARRFPGLMQVRLYAGGPLEATARLPWLWRGVHTLPHDHHFFVTRCRFDFDRAVPLEIGGDLAGDRTSVEMSLAEDAVRLVNWRELHPRA